MAYPDGLDGAWNTGGGCCGAPGRIDPDDVGFITAMVSAIEHAVPVNPQPGVRHRHQQRRHHGLHPGLPDHVFAAIGPDAATELGRCPAPAPVSVIAIHGTADRNIPYDGGGGDGVAPIAGPPSRRVNASWRHIDHCATPHTRTAGVVTTSAANCPSGRAVELITIAGAGHQWPGATPNGLAQKLLHTDPPSTALNATQVIWRFFAAHPGPRR